MPEPVAGIIERLFSRARDDPDAALLADTFAEAYHAGDWTADALDARVRASLAQQAAITETEP